MHTKKSTIIPSHTAALWFARRHGDTSKAASQEAAFLWQKSLSIKSGVFHVNHLPMQNCEKTTSSISSTSTSPVMRPSECDARRRNSARTSRGAACSRIAASISLLVSTSSSMCRRRVGNGSERLPAASSARTVSAANKSSRPSSVRVEMIRSYLQRLNAARDQISYQRGVALSSAHRPALAQRDRIDRLMPVPDPLRTPVRARGRSLFSPPCLRFRANQPCR